MKKYFQNKSGLQILLERARSIFRSENQNYYSKRDYRIAERKFLKYALGQRIIQTEDELTKK